MKPCAWCDRDFQPPQRHHQQQCCSRQCAQYLRQAKQRCEPGYKPPSSNWNKYPTKTTAKGYGGTHQRLRAQLLPRAIGKVCPFYSVDPQCPGLMLQGQRLALDHRIAVALGGTTTFENVRITHHDCNLRAGSRLGATLKHREQRATLNCTQCGKPFTAWSPNQTRCSHACRQAARTPKPPRAVTPKPQPITYPYQCMYCGTVGDSKTPRRTICTARACRLQRATQHNTELKQRYERTCTMCGNQFTSRFSEQPTCGRQCGARYRESLALQSR